MAQDWVPKLCILIGSGFSAMVSVAKRSFHDEWWGLYFSVDRRTNIYNEVRDCAALVKQQLYAPLQGPQHYWPWEVEKISHTRHGFSLVKLVLCQTSELWVTSKVHVPLVHPQGYHDMLVIAVVPRHHSMVEPLVVSIFWKTTWHLLVCLKHIVFSTIRTYLLPLGTTTVNRNCLRHNACTRGSEIIARHKYHKGHRNRKFAVRLDRLEISYKLNP